MRFRIVMMLLASVLILTIVQPSVAQEPAPAEDAIEQLRLSPEQRQKIRLIFAENKDERQLTNRRLREANIALEQTLDAEVVDEALIERRLTEVASAHSAQLRMRIRMELQIRRELGPEQLAAWRRLRLQLRDFADAQRPNNQRPRNQGLRPNRNGLTPAPRRNLNRR